MRKSHVSICEYVAGFFLTTRQHKLKLKSRFPSSLSSFFFFPATVFPHLSNVCRWQQQPHIKSDCGPAGIFFLFCLRGPDKNTIYLQPCKKVFYGCLYPLLIAFGACPGAKPELWSVCFFSEERLSDFFLCCRVS